MENEKRWGMMSTMEQVASDYARAKAEAKSASDRQLVEYCRQKIAAKVKAAASAPVVAKAQTPAVPSAVASRTTAVYAVRRACSYCGRLSAVGSLCCGDEV
jgi:hypothetical protein